MKEESGKRGWLEGWKIGRLEEWKNGRMEEWIVVVAHSSLIVLLCTTKAGVRILPMIITRSRWMEVDHLRNRASQFSNSRSLKYLAKNFIIPIPLSITDLCN